MQIQGQKIHPDLIPKWIWHPERTGRKLLVLSRSFTVERDMIGLEMSIACTGEAEVELDGATMGVIQEHPRHVTLFTKLPAWPSVLRQGRHTVRIVIRCEEPMPLSPVSIHLTDRTVGCIAYMEGGDGFWLVTDDSWEADGDQAEIVCRLGEEPYGDLDNGPEWFVAGGYGDMTTETIRHADVISSDRLTTAANDHLLHLIGSASRNIRFDTKRDDRHLFYHLLKQNEWKLLRSMQNETDLTKVPQAVIDLRQEMNVRFRVRNEGRHEATLLWNGAESLHELRHYDACITECITIPGNGEFVTLPQGMRYLQFFIGSAGADPFHLEIEFESVGVPLEQIGSLQTNLPLLDQIYNVSVHTNKVCHQIGLWDGIKRDRLNWAYDFYMAGKADYVLWNDFTVLKRAIAELGQTPYGHWMNSIPSYTLWWVIGLWEYYVHTGDRKFVLDMKDDLHKHLKWVGENVDRQTGFMLNPHQAFIEWAPMHQEESWVCLNAIMKLMKDQVRSLVAYVPELGLQLDWPDPQIEEAEFIESASALITPLIGIMSGYVSDDKAVEFLAGYKLQDPITPLSAYWLAECYSKYGMHEQAWEVISVVWGTMLDEGATTFWESVVLSPKSDFHDSQTTYTGYDSYRMSLCHSWASTPVQWISKYILGVQPLEPGYKQVRFAPHAIPGLTECRGAVSTPNGPLYIEWSIKDGVMHKSMSYRNEVVST